MYVQVDLAPTPPTVSLEEPDDCKRFHLAVVNGRDAALVFGALVDAAAGRLEGDEAQSYQAWITVDAVRRMAAGSGRRGLGRGVRRHARVRGVEGLDGPQRRVDPGARRVARMTVAAALTDDQGALRDAFGAFFAKEATPARVRAAEPLGFDADLWRDLARLGVPDLALGGQTSLADLAVLAEEFGRHLAPIPLVEALVAARLLERVGGCPADVAAGETIATFAPRAAEAGVARLVPAGAVAGLVVALDGSAAEDALVALRVHDPGSVTSPRTLGATALADRPLDDHLGGRDGTERAVLATGAAARDAFAVALDEWRVLTAAALVGLAQGALDLGVEYVKARHQFGVPIGSFQSIQHKLADLAAALGGARLLARRAAADDRRSSSRRWRRGSRAAPPRTPPPPASTTTAATASCSSTTCSSTFGGPRRGAWPSATLPASWPSSPTGSTPRAGSWSRRVRPPMRAGVTDGVAA